MPTVEIAEITITVEGITKTIQAYPKDFKTGRKGKEAWRYFAQIPKFTTQWGNTYNGQIQLWGELKQ